MIPGEEGPWGMQLQKMKIRLALGNHVLLMVPYVQEVLSILIQLVYHKYRTRLYGQSVISTDGSLEYDAHLGI